jgi:hypothetical protein
VTVEEWIESDNLSELLRTYYVHASDRTLECLSRRLSLFAAASLQIHSSELVNAELRDCWLRLLLIADNPTNETVLNQARIRLSELLNTVQYDEPRGFLGRRLFGFSSVEDELLYRGLLTILSRGCFSDILGNVAYLVRSLTTSLDSLAPACSLDAMRALRHEIFPNPFRPIALDRRWQTPTVVELAETIYTDRAFDRMLLLADALIDAGCDSEKIIAHCRGPCPHVRGCWVLDLLLGKE